MPPQFGLPEFEKLQWAFPLSVTFHNLEEAIWLPSRVQAPTDVHLDSSLLVLWLVHTPREVLQKSMRLPETALAKFPDNELHIFPCHLPGSLEDDKRAVGGKAVEPSVDYTFSMAAMKPSWRMQR